MTDARRPVKVSRRLDQAGLDPRKEYLPVHGHGLGQFAGSPLAL